MREASIASQSDAPYEEDSTLEPGMYRHYQGGLYRVHEVAYDEATLTPMVVYESLGDSEAFPRRSFWTRPLREFLGLVEAVNGTIVPRFVREHAYDNWFL